MKISEMYSRKGKVLKLQDHILSDEMFPEADCSLISSEALQQMDTEQRLVIKELFFDWNDGRYHASVYTVFFDNTPVSVLVNGGRGGHSIKRRWVTDAKAYWQLISYLLQFQSLDYLQDFVGPEAEVFEEEICVINGKNYAEVLGITQEPARHDVQVQEGFNMGEERCLMVSIPPDTELLPEYIRLGEKVMARAAQLSEEQRVDLVESLYVPAGWGRLGEVFAFKQCPRPDGVPVLRIEMPT